MERRDFDAEIAELEIERKEIGAQIGARAVATAPDLLKNLATKTEAARATRDALGKAAIPLFIAVLAADEKREEALAAVQAVQRDFRGDRRAVRWRRKRRAEAAAGGDREHGRRAEAAG